MLKGKNRMETIENYLIAIIFIGAFILSGGMGLSALSAKGFPTVLIMLGSFITFVSTVMLILLWLAKEFRGE